MFRASLLMGQHIVWPVIFIAALKGTIMLAAAGLLSRILKHSSAAVRHVLWCTALFSLVLLLIPADRLARIQIPVLPVELFSGEIATTQLSSADDSETQIRSARPNTLEQSGEPSSPKQSVTERLRPLFNLSWPSVILFLWVAGVLLVVGRLIVGMISVQRLVRGATELNNPSWSALLRELSEQLQLTRRVRLLRSDQSVMPMTCGGLSALVLLPNEADEWSTDRRRIVLLHELIHVKRRDLLTQTFAQIVGALYWFNPLVWFALRQLRKEQEWACDERVLATGIKASDYAGHLLEIGRKFHLDGWPTVTTMALVRRSQLEARLRAILKPALERYQPARAKAVSIAVMCAVFISLVGTQLVRGESAAKVPVVSNEMQLEQDQTSGRDQKAEASDTVAKQSPGTNQSATPTPSPAQAEQPAPKDAGDDQTGEQVFNSFSAEEQNRLSSNGIGPAYINEMSGAGYRQLTVAQLIALFSNAVRADYVDSLRSVGYSGLSTSDLLALKTNGITTDVIKSFQAVKYADFKAMNYIAFRSNGVTPSYLKAMSAVGYDKLTPKQIVDMWVAGVTSEFIRTARSRGQTNLSPEELIELRKREKP